MNERAYNLTDDEANAVKDVLKEASIIINRKRMLMLAEKTNRKPKDFDKLLDSAFIKLGNGRVTIIES